MIPLNFFIDKSRALPREDLSHILDYHDLSKGIKNIEDGVHSPN